MLLVALLYEPIRLAVYKSQGYARYVISQIVVPPHILERRALFIRCIADEASLALALFQALQYGLNQFADLAPRFIDPVRRWGRVAGLILLGPALVGAALGGYWKPAAYAVIPLKATVIGFVVVIVTLGTLFVANAALLIITGMIPFGIQLSCAALWFEISVEALPPGQWTSLIFQPREGFRGLRHGFSYKAAQVTEAIVGYTGVSIRS